MTRFAIITPGRSGSTFLADSLGQHPEVHCEGEIFNRSESGVGTFRAFVNSAWYYRCIGFFFNRESLSTHLLNLPLRCLVGQYLKKKEKCGVTFGFKISLDQLFAYPQLIKALQRSYKIIYLTREDRERMVLSLLMTRMSKSYEQYLGEKISLAPSNVQRQLNELMAWEQECLQLFEDRLYVTYEELFNDIPKAMKKIQQYLHLQRAIVPVNSSQAHPTDISEWIENYEEIKSYLHKNTQK